MQERTAAIVVIGNEILSGKAEDTNSRFLIAELRDLGVRLMRIEVVPDDCDDIAAAVRACAARYDHVFTSGGVGPTHDDCTMEGVARAFDRRVVRNAELEGRLRRFFGAALAERNLRMADLPEGAELVAADQATWPVVACANVYILPGVPEIFRRKFMSIRERFRHQPFFLRVVYSTQDEALLAPHLDQVDADFPDVEVGSYPRLGEPEWRVKITLESRDAAQVERAFAALLERLPRETVARTE